MLSGNGKPSKKFDNGDAPKAFVASTPASIGYLDASKIDGYLKVVLKQ